MDGRSGKRIRLGRLFRPESGNSLIVAYSHGVLLGPSPGMRGLREMRATVAQLAGADGIMLAPGLVDKLEENFAGRDRPSLVLHLDWTNFSRRILPYEQGAQTGLATIEEAAAAGADGVMTYLLLGHDDPAVEAAEVARNAAVARACERYGLVHVIEPRHGLERRSPELKLDPAIMQLYCRVAGEIGADVIKCVWSGSVESMAAIVESCIAPVLMAGGAQQEDFAAALALAQAAMGAGCRGLVFGRNIYQHPEPAVALAALLDIVHGGVPV